jgi:hypothetical protein
MKPILDYCNRETLSGCACLVNLQEEYGPCGSCDDLSFVTLKPLAFVYLKTKSSRFELPHKLCTTTVVDVSSLFDFAVIEVVYEAVCVGNERVI